MERPDHISGNWRATVTNVDDPTKSGRVMISISSLRLTGMWAEPAVAIGGSSEHGSYVVPRVGDKLFVFFDGGNIKHPIYFAMSPSQGDIPVAFNGGEDPLVKRRNDGAMQNAFWSEPTTNPRVEYPYGQGIKFPGGTLLVVDESSGETKLAYYHPSNSYEEVNNDGTHIVRVAGDEYEIILGNKFIYLGGAVSEYIAKDFDQTIGGNEEKSVGGSGISTFVQGNTVNVGTNFLTNVGGGITANVSGAVSLACSSILASFVGGTMEANAAGIALSISQTLQMNASSWILTALNSVSIVAPQTNITSALVKLGLVGTVPVHVAGMSYCPYIGAPVTGGSTTILGSP